MLIHDEDKLREFMRSIEVIKVKRRLQNIEDKEDPMKFINRNLELAEIWDEYDQDRKRLIS
jgi:hypothetical protein